MSKIKKSKLFFKWSLYSPPPLKMEILYRKQDILQKNISHAGDEISMRPIMHQNIFFCICCLVSATCADFCSPLVVFYRPFMLRHLLAEKQLRGSKRLPEYAFSASKEKSHYNLKNVKVWQPWGRIFSPICPTSRHESLSLFSSWTRTRDSCLFMK